MQSLEALGIDGRSHDIRFVEDNWESPVLGAWGLGWEVWMDGMEITQFTYFQQTGSLTLPVPAIEITYGLERILMTLQNVHHFKDIRYTDSLTYGELLLQTEIEMSEFNMNEADVEDQWKRFEIYKKEAERMVERRLALPAYDHLLKCSHAFNVLDARGAVGVTERNVCFGTMRKMAQSIAKLWLERREEMEFPLLKTPLQEHLVHSNGRQTIQNPKTSRLMVLEVGCEELPPDDVVSAINQLETKFKAMLEASRLVYRHLEVHGTTRRLSILVHDLVGEQSAVDTKIRGPPAKIAYESDGSPSKALLGFCKKNQCSVDSVFVEKDGKGTEFVFGMRHERAASASDVLMETIPALLQSVTFRKSMRWNGDTTWSRPIRWLLALHGDAVLPIEFAGLKGQSTTQLLRNEKSGSANISSAEDYLETIRNAGIVLKMEERKEKIWQNVQKAAESVNGFVPGDLKGSLLEEVSNLVEAPSPILASFDSQFLSLPKEVLQTVMQKYQRYFVIYASDGGQLLPHFVSIGNGDFDENLVRSGNEDVLTARFKDAQFFYEEDLQRPLESFRPKLVGTQFHKELGNLLEKVERTERLVKPFSTLLKLENVLSVAERAASISKADLATSLVTEMTSLAGTMGRHYALKSGENENVAEAVFEASLPRFSGDLLPKTPAGLIVSLADKIDSLVGLIAVKCAPTATADPYGLRRMAYGLVEALIQNERSFDIKMAIHEAAEIQPVSVSEDIENETIQFVARRLEQFLLDQGVAAEIGKTLCF